jgi:uncharacterized membrane protein
MSLQDLSVMIVFAVLYATGVIGLAPISFHLLAQVRLADALLLLSMIFGVPSAMGVGLGCAVANVYGGFGMVDVVGGAAANIIAGTLAWYIAKRRGIAHRVMGTIVQTVVITAIVGGYLAIIFEVPLEFGLLGVLIGSIIAINIIGFAVEEAMLRSATVREWRQVIS